MKSFSESDQGKAYMLAFGEPHLKWGIPAECVKPDKQRVGVVSKKKKRRGGKKKMKNMSAIHNK